MNDSNLRQLLTNAIEVQKELRGETVTKEAVAALLFPSRNPKTQYQNLNNLLNGHTRITGETVRELVKIFPDTSADYWLSLLCWKELNTTFASTYKLDEIDANKDLRRLYEYLIDKKYSKELYNQYL